MLVIRLFQLLVESRPTESFVDNFEPCKNTCLQFLEREWGEVRAKEGVERCSWCGVGCVQADAYNEIVIPRRVRGVD